LFKVERTLRIYVTAQRSPLKSIEFVTLRVKDAVCDRFRAGVGQRPNIDTKAPDVRIHLFLTDRQASLYLDTSGEPLWQRGHKIAKIGAPLKENLAAGILRLAGWRPGMPLLDPMCGSGTFLLEAAQMALDDAPGLGRDLGEFGFERLLDFDALLWRRLGTAAAERRQEARPLPIWGSDISADAVARARQNLAHAGLDDLVQIEQADVLVRDAPAAEGVMVANPPYGERLGDADELAVLYPRLGDMLKRNFHGWNCWLLSADSRLPKLIGLRPTRKIPLFNGNLECRLYGFPVVAGSNRPK
jgi:putative N6-adenine-specific DNA methylase